MTRKRTTVVRRRRTRNKKGGMKKRMRGGAPTVVSDITIKPMYGKDDDRKNYKHNEVITITNASVETKYNVRKITPDGKCLFTALSYGINGNYDVNTTNHSGVGQAMLEMTKTQINNWVKDKTIPEKLIDYDIPNETPVPINVVIPPDKLFLNGQYQRPNLLSGGDTTGQISEAIVISYMNNIPIIIYNATGSKIYNINPTDSKKQPIYLLHCLSFDGDGNGSDHFDLLIPILEPTPNPPPLSSASSTNSSTTNQNGWLGWLASFLPDPAAIPTSGEPYNLVISVDKKGNALLQVYTPQIGTVANAENFLQAITNDKPMFEKPIKVNIDTTGKMTIIPDLGVSGLPSSSAASGSAASGSAPTDTTVKSNESELAAIKSAVKDANIKAKEADAKAKAANAKVEEASDANENARTAATAAASAHTSSQQRTATAENSEQVMEYHKQAMEYYNRAKQVVKEATEASEESRDAFEQADAAANKLASLLGLIGYKIIKERPPLMKTKP